MEPLGNLNRCFTVRNMPGVPFDAPYACTGMHESGNPLFINILLLSIHTILVTNLNHELNQGVAPLGLTHLTYHWRAKQVRDKTRNKRSKRVCMRVYVLFD